MVSSQELERTRQAKRDLVNLIVRKIDGLMKRKEEPGVMFISDGALKSVIDEHKREIFAFEPWLPQQEYLVRKKCYHVLGILIYIGCVDNLQNLFFKNSHSVELDPDAITDNRLWIIDPSELWFLDHQLQSAFYHNQFILKAYHFDGRLIYQSDLLKVPREARLPFEEAKIKLGSGHFGTVTQVKVASGHYTGLNGNTNHEPRPFALKDFTTSKDHHRELKSLGILNQSLTKHQNIVRHKLAFAHGETSFNILLPLAEYGTLETLLNEGYDIAESRQGYNFREKFPNFDRGHDRCIHDTLEQMAHVVDGVRWLHGGFHVNLIMIHRDLKPDNILITADRGILTPDRGGSTIGRWKLSDLGISVTQPQGLVSVGDAVSRIGAIPVSLSPQNVRTSAASQYGFRPPGSYTAPEIVRNAILPDSDVWSLACILAEVLAFSTGGKASVDEFSKQRIDGALDRKEAFYIENPSTVTLPKEKKDYLVNPKAIEWLEDLASRENDWVKCCVKIITNTLVVDISHRPKAADLSHNLGHLIGHHNRDRLVSGLNCPNLHQKARLEHSQTQSSSQTQLSSPQSPNINTTRRSSSITLEHRPNITASLSRSQLNLISGRQEYNQAIQHPADRAPKGKWLLSAIDMAVSPGGGCSFWLFKSKTKHHEFEVVLAFLNGSTRSTQRPQTAESQHSSSSDCVIQLPLGVEWTNLKASDRYVVVQGKAYKASDKQFKFYDLTTEIIKDLSISHHEEMNRVEKGAIAISISGFILLQATKKLLLFDMKSDQKTPSKLLSIPEDGYSFSAAAFSPGGEYIVAWCWGQNLDNALIVWTVNAESRAVSGPWKHQVETHKKNRCPAQSVIPFLEGSTNTSLGCIVREADTMHNKSSCGYFLVRFTSGKTKLDRDYLTRESKRDVDAIVYKGNQLVTLGKLSSKEISPVRSYSLQVSQGVKRNFDGVKIADFEAKGSCKLQIIPRDKGLSLIALLRDYPQFHRIQFQEPT